MLSGAASIAEAQDAGAKGKTRLAVIGLDHDHVWSLLKDVAGEPAAELIAIAESDAGLVARAHPEHLPGRVASLQPRSVLAAWASALMRAKSRATIACAR